MVNNSRLNPPKPTVLAGVLASGLFVGASFSLPAHAQTLREVWASAAAHSPQAKVNAAQLSEGKAVAAQASTLFKPQIGLQGALGYQDIRTETKGAYFSAPAFSQMGLGAVENAEFKTKVSGAFGGQVGAEATYPLYNPRLNAQAKQLNLAGKMAELQNQSATEALYIQVAQSYYQLALAEAEVAVNRKHLTAVKKSHEEAAYRFKIGDAPITGVHEAKANLSMVEAQLAAAQAKQLSAQSALARLATLPASALTASLPKVSLADAQAFSNHTINGGANAAIAQNTSLQLQRLSETKAMLAAREADPKSALKVDAIAKAQLSYASGDGYGGDGLAKQYQHLLGVQVSLPIYTGGALDANYQTALAGVKTAQTQTEVAAQSIATQADGLRAEYEALFAQREALIAAKKASQLRVDATTLGKRIGDKTVLDVLNAQNDLSAVELKIAQTEVQIALTKLKLAQLYGELDDMIQNSLVS